jgi:hypothetical protein
VQGLMPIVGLRGRAYKGAAKTSPKGFSFLPQAAKTTTLSTAVIGPADCTAHVLQSKPRPWKSSSLIRPLRDHTAANNFTCTYVDLASSFSFLKGLGLVYLLLRLPVAALISPLRPFQGLSVRSARYQFVSLMSIHVASNRFWKRLRNTLCSG